MIFYQNYFNSNILVIFSIHFLIDRIFVLKAINNKNVLTHIYKIEIEYPKYSKFYFISRDKLKKRWKYYDVNLGIFH